MQLLGRSREREKLSVWMLPTVVYTFQSNISRMKLILIRLTKYETIYLKQGH